MFPPAVRIPLIVLAAAGDIYLVVTGQLRGWLLILAAALLTYGHFRYSSVWAAFQALKYRKAARARSLIAKVSRPDRLNAQHLAYFHFVHGFLDLDEESFDTAEKHLLLAAEGALRTDNDRSVVLLGLAEIKARTGNADAAREYLRKARSLPHRSELTAALEKIEAMIEESSRR